MEAFVRQWRRIKDSSRGQGIVEYLMMMAVVVGVVLVVGRMFKPQVSSIFMGVMEKIQRAVESVGGTGGGY
ncbi:MAG: hypothetical protein HY928_14840 [Elusimicrobia bacterium]|nr:hypothetical protein [Elusimicrobiota bacterium]